MKLIDMNIINLSIAIRKRITIKVPDTIIAATALSNNLILVTRNEKDFGKIDGLKIYNPFNVE